MMSQQYGTRQRKAPSAASGDASRTRGKASGDSAPYNLHAKQHSQRSRSKNKIPKSIRYDLDNALVGLCDVWFEEIKPHLIRNNIKVHVHPDGGEDGGPASGDHDRIPPSAPGCSHFNPGAASDVQEHQRRVASSASCCSTPPTASKVQCHKPRSPTSLRLPPVHSHHPESLLHRSPKTQFIRPNRKSRTRNKWTQTDSPCPISGSSPTPPAATPKLIDIPAKSTSMPKKQNCDNQRQLRFVSRSPHFPNDLIDIIGEKYDRRLRILFKSPRETEEPSQMNLILTPRCRQTKVGGARKHLAWK